MNLLPTDELNAIRPRIETILRTMPKDRAKKELEDEILDLLLIAYTFGCEDANEMLGTTIAPTYAEMRDSIYHKTKGETFVERLAKWVEKGDAEGVYRIADTESHRVYCDAELKTAKTAAAPMPPDELPRNPLPFEEESAWPGGGSTGREPLLIYKEWMTMMDDKVRDTHDYLEGMKVPLDAMFMTFDGDQAEAPGGFELAENNVQCRCWLKLTKG